MHAADSEDPYQRRRGSEETNDLYGCKAEVWLEAGCRGGFSGKGVNVNDFVAPTNRMRSHNGRDVAPLQRNGHGGVQRRRCERVSGSDVSSKVVMSL